MYHQVGQPAAKGTPFRGLTVHPDSFKRQMHWLRLLGYRGLSMRDLMPYLKGERQGKVVGITFDDGYQNVFDNALPVLQHCGFTATNYFVVRQLGGSNVWDHDLGIPAAPLMNQETVRRWHDAGMEVGSHTLDHPHLPALSTEIAILQIRQSRGELEALIDRPVTAFCYPYGDESPAIRQLAREAGYLNATTTARGLVRPDDDLFELPRVTVARSTHLLRFLQKCLTRLEDRRRSSND
ncbi:polysaccharide deacetylase family protein [Pusillimonas sp. CC-YST705]|uniref:Polysaccharide deacetylase family protein n=1 Tax=Mesopusillimonas faecipullorum TaxID=2755040 RepID=A0ABS8C8L5_9BURK|nr:polysaccharide deacetylase family protein [Mesopusillimonas faecipullorum]MCB5362365.1 polysaccharide deacetylase family protein [Mesopusillimonas faecipullorum]